MPPVKQVIKKKGSGYTPKQNKGRKTKFRVFYSTLNTAKPVTSFLTSSLAPSLTTFTGVYN